VRASSASEAGAHAAAGVARGGGGAVVRITRARRGGVGAVDSRSHSNSRLSTTLSTLTLDSWRSLLHVPLFARLLPPSLSLSARAAAPAGCNCLCRLALVGRASPLRSSLRAAPVHPCALSLRPRTSFSSAPLCTSLRFSSALRLLQSSARLLSCECAALRTLLAQHVVVGISRLSLAGVRTRL
jgi:hypothetical protein